MKHQVIATYTDPTDGGYLERRRVLPLNRHRMIKSCKKEKTKHQIFSKRQKIVVETTVVCRSKSQPKVDIWRDIRYSGGLQRLQMVTVCSARMRPPPRWRVPSRRLSSRSLWRRVPRHRTCSLSWLMVWAESWWCEQLLQSHGNCWCVTGKYLPYVYFSSKSQKVSSTFTSYYVNTERVS